MASNGNLPQSDLAPIAGGQLIKSARYASGHYGLVTDDSPLTVTIGGQDLACLKLTSYTATIGDRVYVLRAGQDPPLVIGEIG